MGLKAILDSVDNLDEGLKGLYSEDSDGKFVLQIDNVDDHPKVSGLVRANKENVRLKEERLKTIESLKAQLGELPEDFSVENWEALKAGEGKPDEQIAKLKETYENRIAALDKKHQGELAKKDETLQGLDDEIVSNFRSENLSRALNEVGVSPELLPAAKAMFEQKVKIIKGEDGKRRGIFDTNLGEVSIQDHIKEWASSDAGKPFIKAPTGPNPSGGKGGAKGSKTITRAEFDALGHQERSARMKDGYEITE